MITRENQAHHDLLKQAARLVDYIRRMSAQLVSYVWVSFVVCCVVRPAASGIDERVSFAVEWAYR